MATIIPPPERLRQYAIYSLSSLLSSREAVDDETAEQIAREAWVMASHMMDNEPDIVKDGDK